MRWLIELVRGVRAFFALAYHHPPPC